MKVLIKKEYLDALLAACTALVAQEKMASIFRPQYAQVIRDGDTVLRQIKDEVAVLQQLPEIVCLCGSTRFSQAFHDNNLALTMCGKIVLSIGCDMRSDTEIFGAMNEAQRDGIKRSLDELHLRKIELADRVLVLNVGGYIGESTRREIAHAQSLGKKIEYLEPLGEKAVNPDGEEVEAVLES